jgi:two-component system sensor histidine kinase YesM
MSKILSDNADKEYINILNQINSNLESQLDVIQSTLIFFISNPLIRENLEKEAFSEGTITQAMKKLEIEKQLSYMLINNYLWDSKLIKSVYIFENKDYYYHIEHNDLPVIVSSQNNLKAYKTISINNEDLKIVAPSKTDATIYFVKNMRSMYSLDYIGTIIFAIDISSLSKVYDDINHYTSALAFVIDSNNDVLLHTDSNMLGSKINNSLFDNQELKQLKEVHFKDENYLAATKAIKKYNLTSTIAVPKNQILSNLSKSILEYYNVILLILFFFLIISVFLSSRVLKPIKDMMKNIGYLRNGIFTVKMPQYKDYEFNQLSDVFNKMTSEIQYLINDVYKKQLLLKDAELKSLQSQINPHFLFNVLDTISWHARTAGNTNINDIVTPLSHILRANITMGSREKVTIREELQYVEFYLSIQKIRFGDRLITELNISDDYIRDFFIPKLCIQPLVENAVVHGLEEKIEDGKLTINLYSIDNIIIFEIIDNGVGFAIDKLNLDQPDNPFIISEKHTNIGLYNSNKRIKLIYGDEYGICVESKLNQGTQVTVRIPIDKGEL